MRGILSLLFAISGITVLSALSIVENPLETSLVNISKYEGRIVEVEGSIQDITITHGGNTIIKISDGSETADIFLYGEKKLYVGDRVTIIGRVQRYMGKYEIVADKISLKSKTETNVTLWQLAEHPIRFLNTRVNISGYVYDLSDSGLSVRDGPYHIEVTPPLANFGNLSIGDKVRITGEFLYDRSTFSYYILSIEVKKIG